MNNHKNKHKALRKSFKASDMNGKHYERDKIVDNKMNPIRKNLLETMKELITQTLGDHHINLELARQLNQEFLSRSRGKGRNARAF